MKRRGNSEDNGRLRGDGRREASIRVKGQRPCVYGRTRRGATEKMTAALRVLDDGIHPDDGQDQVAGYLLRWLEHAARPTLKARTWEGYESIVRVRGIPRIFRRRLDKLTALDLRALDAGLSVGGLQPHSVLNTHRMLRRTLDQAPDWRMIVCNSCDGASPSRARTAALQARSGAKAALLLHATAARPRHACSAIALAAGAPPGEALALRRTGVDLAAGRPAVRLGPRHEIGTGIIAVESATRRRRRPPAIDAVELACRWEEPDERPAAGPGGQEQWRRTPGRSGTPGRDIPRRRRDQRRHVPAG